MSATLVAEVSYAGGGTPVVIPVQALECNTQIGLVGTDSASATIEVQAAGTTAYETITVLGTHTTIIIEKTILSNIRVTVAAAGSYKITVWQFKS